MNKPPIKAILSTLLILGFLFLALTGALLYFGKTGVVLGISRHDLRVIHFWTAAIICVLAAVHLCLNCRVYLSELRSLRRAQNGKSGNPDPGSRVERRQDDR